MSPRPNALVALLVCGVCTAVACTDPNVAAVFTTPPAPDALSDVGPVDATSDDAAHPLPDLPSPPPPPPADAALVVEVVSVESGEPLEGITVLVEGTPGGTATATTNAVGVAWFLFEHGDPITVTATAPGWTSYSVVGTRATALRVALSRPFQCPRCDTPDASDGDATADVDDDDVGNVPPPPPPLQEALFRGTVLAPKTPESAGYSATCASTSRPSQKLTVPLGDTFDLLVPLGEFAVYCFLDGFQGQPMPPLYLGVLRHLFASTPTAMQGTVALTLPTRYAVGLLADVPEAWADAEVAIDVDIVLGPEGVIPLPLAPSPPYLTAVRPPPLEGPLEGTSFRIRTTASAQGSAATTLQQDVATFAAGDRVVRQANAWAVSQTSTAWPWTAIARRDDATVLVGDGGRMRYETASATPMELAIVDEHLRAVAVAPLDGTMFAAGDGGVVLVADQPDDWRVVPTPGDAPVTGLVAVAADEAYAIAGSQLWRFDGAVFDVDATAPAPLRAMTVYGPWIVAVGDAGTVFQYQDGGSGSLPVPAYPADLRAVAVDAGGHLHVASADQMWRLGDDDVWVETTPPGGVVGLATLARDPSDDALFAGGRGGLLLQWTGDVWERVAVAHPSTIIAFGGMPWSALTAHDYLLDPVPPPTDPTLADGDVSWTAQPESDVVLLRVDGTQTCEPCEPLGVARSVTNESWYLVTKGPADGMQLPDLFAAAAPVGMTPGPKTLTIYQGKTDWDFDIDDPPPWSALFNTMTEYSARTLDISL